MAFFQIPTSRIDPVAIAAFLADPTTPDQWFFTSDYAVWNNANTPLISYLFAGSGVYLYIPDYYTDIISDYIANWT